jgi:hypothetical protein
VDGGWSIAGTFLFRSFENIGAQFDYGFKDEPAHDAILFNGTTSWPLIF